MVSDRDNEVEFNRDDEDIPGKYPGLACPM